MSSSADFGLAAAQEARPAPVADLRLVRIPEAMSEAERAAHQAAEQRARSRAEADGYAAGYFRGVADARRRAQEELSRARAALEAAGAESSARRDAEVEAATRALRLAAQGLADRAAALREEVVTDAADLAALLVEAMLGRELGRLDAETAAADVVRRVVAALGDLAAEGSGHGDRIDAVVRLSPALTAMISEDDRATLAALGARLVPDTSLAEHDAVVDAASTRVDLRLASTLQHVQAALREDPR